MTAENKRHDAPFFLSSSAVHGVILDKGNVGQVLPDNGRPKRLIDYVFFQVSDTVGQEQAQGMARIAITSILTLLFLIRAIYFGGDFDFPLMGGVYCIVGAVHYGLARHSPERFLWRRYLATAADQAMGGYIVYRLGFSGLAFYPLFLWIIIGAGLRYGPQFLMVVSVTGPLAFLAGALAAGLGNTYPMVLIGMVLGLILMPKFFLLILQRLAAMNEALREQRNHAQQLATHDPLTGLPNRVFLDERLVQVVSRAKRSGGSGAVILLDLDDFKSVNDNFGHDHGDLLLQDVAHCLRNTVRASDSVIRFGGDEFIILIEDSKQVSDLVATAEQLINSLRRNFQIGEYQAYVTCSCGVAIFPHDGEDALTLIKHADTAMYRAKNSGRNTFCIYDTQMSAAAATQLRTRLELRHAIDDGQFLLHYQPVLEMPSRRVVGAEALVRWQHPQRDIVPPNEFIPLAEAAGLILPLGDWILESACTQLARWASQPEMTKLTVSVNLSALQFRMADFADRVAAIIKWTGANPQRLKLEITESLLVSDVDEVITKMRALKELGVGFALDDFGTGYSSLAYLSRLPLNQLKIDRSFVANLETNESDAIICAATINLAHSLMLAVVAEGVETEAQAHFLSTVHGCNFIQGFLFSRPLPADEFETYVRQRSTMSEHRPQSDR
jgi:diguanylate cyclase (GGDEF)-like protein